MPPAKVRVCSTTNRTTRASLPPGAAAARSNPITTNTADFFTMVILRSSAPVQSSTMLHASFRRGRRGCRRHRGLQPVVVNHDALLVPDALLERPPEAVLILGTEARLDHRRRGLE